MTMKGQHVTPTLYVDDLMILAAGPRMSKTHAYLIDMGTRVSAEKSFNVATHPRARKWLSDIIWPTIKTNIQVVLDFKYLGS